MKNTLKIKRGGAFALAELLIILFAIGLLMMPKCYAQATPSGTTGQGVTVFTTLAAATTTNMATPVFIDAGKQQNVAFSMTTTWSTAGEATGNTNIVYTLAPSVDGVNKDTNKTVSVIGYNYTSAGNLSTSCTNLSANGLAGWFVIKAVNNSAAGVATNTASTGLQYGVKIGAP